MSYTFKPAIINFVKRVSIKLSSVIRTSSHININKKS